MVRCRVLPVLAVPAALLAVLPLSAAGPAHSPGLYASVRGRVPVNPTPTPTLLPGVSPTPTPAFPPDSAAGLLAAAQTTMHSAGTVHVVQVAHIILSGIDRQVSTLQGDLDYTRGSFTLAVVTRDTPLGTAHPHTRVTHAQVIQSRSIFGVRSGGGTWQCGAASDDNAIPGGLLATLTPGPTTSVTFAHTRQTTLKGVPVWHLRVNVSVHALGAVTHIDVLVGRDDQRIYRERVATHLTVPIRHGKQVRNVASSTVAVTDFSRFGAPVTIILPPVCTP